MLKSKKFNGSLIGIVVLSVLLVMAITVGSTLAWFASQDTANQSFTLGGAVVVKVADDEAVKTDGKLTMNVPATYLVPGMALYPTIYADIEQTTTPSLLRAKVEIQVSNDNLEQDDLDAIELAFHTQIKNRANGWANDETESEYFYFVGNGEAYSFQMTAPSQTTVEDGNVVGVNAEYTAVGAAQTGTFTDGATNTSFLGTGEDQVASIKFYNDAQDTPLTGTGFKTVGEDMDAVVYAHIPFLVRPISIDYTLGNIIAGTEITITITFEALQDFVFDIAQENTDVYTAVLPTLNVVKAAFEDALVKNPTNP